VERLFEAVRGSGLGVLGADDTLAALKLGQVDELVITADPDTLTNVDHLVPAGVAPPATHTGSAAQGLAAVDAAAAALSHQPEAAAEEVPAHEKVANQLVTLARQTSAAVRFIEDSALLAEVGGVGGFLRFRVQEN
jgi:peptide subunit release factor 1 (eRF1)